MQQRDFRLKLYRGVWCAVWREAGRTRRVSLRTSDRDTAARALEDIRRPAPIGGTVAVAIERYLADKAGKPSISSIAFSLRPIRPHFGALRPDQVTRDSCQAYTGKRRKAGIADSSIRRELANLRAALRWADKATPAVIVLPPSPPPRERHLAREEYARLLAAAIDPHMRLFIVLALATAARKTALLELTWDRVDMERRRIALRSGRPGGKGRATVPMTEAAYAALTEARKAAVSDYVIEYAGRKVADIKKGFQSAVDRAGLSDVTPHILRHTAAVWMAEAGVPMDAIAQYLGHSSPAITYRVYARFSPDYLRGAARALEA